MPSLCLFRTLAVYCRLIICLYIPCCCYSQSLTYIHYNTNTSALPHDICYELMQDKHGYIWISTDDGLVRFDGRDMKVYRDGLKSRYVIATSQYENDFFISTWKGGVHKLQNDSIYPVQGLGTDSILTNNTNGVLVYQNIVILYEFFKAMPFKYDREKNTLTSIVLQGTDNKGHSQSITSDKGYKFCIINHQFISYSGEAVYLWQNGRFRQLSGNGYERITQDISGKVFGLKNNHIYALSPDLKTSVIYRKIPAAANPEYSDVDRFFMLPSGNAMIHLANYHSNPAEHPQGKYLFINFNTEEVFDLLTELHINALITGLLIDREQGFWLSTDGSGLYHVFEPRYRQLGKQGEFRNPFITALLSDGPEHLYIGTKNGIYLLSNRKTTQIYPAYWNSSFYRDSAGKIIAKSKHLMSDIVLEANKAQLLGTHRFYSRGQRYTIHMGDYQYVTDNQTGEVQKGCFEFTPQPIRHVVEDIHNTIWLGCDRGLYYWQAGHTATVFPNSILRQTSVNSLLPDSSGGIWVGTNSGLFYIFRQQVQTYYHERNGLSNDHINALLFCNGKLWAGTQSGLNIINLQTGRISVLKTFDGLIANDITALALFARDMVAVGSSRGLSIIDARQPEQVIDPPDLLLENIFIDGVKRQPEVPIIARYNSRLIFTYNVVTFMYPELVQFQYRLSASAPWIDTRNKSIILTDQEPGEYQLQIRARKYNSKWSDPLILLIEVQKPWWQTTTFYVMIVAALLIIIYLLLRRKEMDRRRQSLLQQQFAELKLKALQTQLNPHFISNTLSAIQYFTLSNRADDANEYLTRFADMTRLLLEASRTRFITLKHEIDIAEHYLALEMLRFANRFTYTITTERDIETSHELIPGMLLQPFIENSINHGIVYLPKDIVGTIELNIRKNDEMLEIQIRDNGIGRDKAREIQRRVGKAYRSRSSEIIEEIRQSINNLADCYIYIDVNDITDVSGKVSGTAVTIRCRISATHTHI